MSQSKLNDDSIFNRLYQEAGYKRQIKDQVQKVIELIETKNK